MNTLLILFKDIETGNMTTSTIRVPVPSTLQVRNKLMRDLSYDHPDKKITITVIEGAK